MDAYQPYSEQKYYAEQNADQVYQTSQGSSEDRFGGPSLPGARPFVDPNASGQVDVSSYPEPKESTSKIRGRSDILELLCNNVSQDLLIAKTFYFFFFSAFGSLFPLMGVYFKQLGLNSAMTGLLVGCRPFVEFVASPFWGSIADRFQKGKLMLLSSIAASIIFTLSLGFIQPPATSCITFNGTHHVLRSAHIQSPETAEIEEEARKKRHIDAHLFSGTVTPSVGSEGVDSLPVMPHLYHKRSLLLYEEALTVEMTEPEFSDLSHGINGRRRRKREIPLPPNHIIGKSPIDVSYTANFHEFNKTGRLISPPFSSIVYRESDVQKAFFLLLLLVILGEFFSCPAMTLADTVVLTYLEDESDNYGRQRMFGSLGWGLAMFFVGIALDHSTAFPGHACGPHERERNYTICFAIFSVLMGCALTTATQFKFSYSADMSTTLPMEQVQEPVDKGPRPWNEPRIPLQEKKTGREQFEEVIGNFKTRIFANTMKEMPEWMVVLREFKTVRLGAFLVAAFWMGFGIGLIFAFLFWHLQDIGGTPTVFGIASIINHISEIFAYFFSFRLISQIGHVKVLCLGLVGNVLRFLYISIISNPWWVLPFEFIQGVTHAAVWAACCSYIAHNTRAELRAQAQGVLQGIHHGLGRGCGAILGGLCVNYFGTPKVFRSYGILSLVVLGAFVFINFYRKDVGFQHELPPEEDPRQMAEEGTALAPHGVPANPLPRAHSSQKLNDQAPDQSSYGTYTTNGMLSAPDGGNPMNLFLTEGGGGDVTGGGYQYSLDQREAVITLNKPSLSLDNPFHTQGKYFICQDTLTSPALNPSYDAIKYRFQDYDALLHSIQDKVKDVEDTSPHTRKFTESQQNYVMPNK